MADYRRFVVGDIHGALPALQQCIERSGFDAKHDMLICLGDVCDGWPDVSAVFDLLLSVKNLVYILGNHDYWAMEWMETGYSNENWLSQGGWATVNSYKSRVPKSHIQLLASSNFFFELDNKLFVHGGFDPLLPLSAQDRNGFLWDRTLVEKALTRKDKNNNKPLSSYDEIYLGHTPTINYKTDLPIRACEVFLMDTGAGWSSGKLTCMDIDSKDIFQSDPVGGLYPGHHGRSR